MNLLPHKSWNVWNRDNREKVESDQKTHKEEEEKKRKRSQEIEQEVRYNKLKDRAKKRKEDIGDQVLDQYIPPQLKLDSDPTSPAQIKHINFFEDIEKGSGPLTSVDRDQDKEPEKKSQVRGKANDPPKPSSDFEVPIPWYSKGTSVPPLPEEKQKRDETHKSKDDPLATMNKYLSRKKESKKLVQQHQQENEKKKSIEKMRQDRLQREQEEKSKIAEIMNKGAPKLAKEDRHTSERTYYNNQFLRQR